MYKLSSITDIHNFQMDIIKFRLLLILKSVQLESIFGMT